MKRLLALCLSMVLFALLVTGGVVALAEHATDSETEAEAGEYTGSDRLSSEIFEDPSPESDDHFDRVEYTITVESDSSARWTVHYVRTLENESDVEEFEEFAETFNAEETQLYRDFEEKSQTLAERAANETARDMTATAFEREAFVTTGLETDIGVVEMSFTWTEFAAVHTDRLVVGDVFENGLYLDEDQRLVFETGEGLAFENATPEPNSLSHDTLNESESITWDQEGTFDEGEPWIVFTAASTDTAVLGPDQPPETGSDNATIGDTIVDRAHWILIAGVLAVVLGGTAAVVYRLGRPIRSIRSGSRSAGSTSTDAVQSPVTDAELLSDEDRVINLLEANGGRMKQVNIVDRCEWSKSKVSMLLSDMEERELISKLRVGRENIISLKGHEPDATRSPLDDEV